MCHQVSVGYHFVLPVLRAFSYVKREGEDDGGDNQLCVSPPSIWEKFSKMLPEQN